MTISLRLDDQLTRKLAAAAKAKGISKSALIRECLQEYFSAKESEPTAWELGKHLFGRHNVGAGDLSVRAKEIAREHALAKYAKSRRR